MGGSGWKKVRSALGLSSCTSPAPDASNDFEDNAFSSPNDTCKVLGNGSAKGRRRISAASLALATEMELSVDSTPSRSPLHRFRSVARFSKSACAICLESMKPGNGHAIFTAECSHAFHFPCIASNVRHGNLFCPVCRAAWKEVPWQAPAFGKGKNPASQEPNPRSARPMTLRQQEALRNAEEDQRRMEPVLRILDESIATFRVNRQAEFPVEPPTFDDDEPLEEGPQAIGVPSGSGSSLEISLQPEVEAIASANACEMTVLVHVKAMNTSVQQQMLTETARAAVDLVTVLDVSGSMSGTKLMLVKRAMTFVIDALGSADRLSVVVFSSHAKRVFPLQRMPPEGRRSAKRVIDKLSCTGGTNIGEGLVKATKVLSERRQRNPVTGIMLLSDGQDTCCMTPRRTPSQVPVHSFGFGLDHDATTMHRISEDSGGTFSFIQSEFLLQDAFAQCLGGLLSVVVQDVTLKVGPVSEGVTVESIQAGSYGTDMESGTVKLGDLYADEERHVLVDLKIPSTKSLSTEALTVSASYILPVTHQTQIGFKTLSVPRPDVVHGNAAAPNVEVQRQKNRLKTAKAIAEARSLADRCRLSEANEVLQQAKASLAPTGDDSWRSLEGELSEIASRMANLQTYERSGRAYVLSAQTCHMRQRATTRGDTIDNLSREYQTPSMVSMISLSQLQQSISPRDMELRRHPSSSATATNNISSSPPSSSAWKLAKAAVLRKPSTKVSDLHGFEKAGF